MESTWIFYIGPIAFDGTVTTMTALTLVIVFGLIYWSSRNMQMRPKGKQNVLEWVVDFVAGITKDNLGSEESPRFLLFGFTLFTFLLVSNSIGLVTELTTTNDVSLWKSPTANVVIDLTFSLMIIVLSNLVGVQKFGLVKYFKNSFMHPLAALLPLNLLEEFTNTLSLGLRLYGNIFAGEVMLSLITSIWGGNIFLMPVSIIVDIVWIGFSLFISALQAYVFTLLSSLYISHKVLVEES